MILRLTILFGAMAVVAFAAGCGGASAGDDSASGSEITVSTSSLSKAQYVKEAEAICADGHEKFLTYQGPISAGPSEKEKAKVTKAVEAIFAPSLQEVVDRLSELGAPQGDEAQVEALLSALQEGVDTLEERSASMSSLEEIETPLRPAGKLAREYGLQGCIFGE